MKTKLGLCVVVLVALLASGCVQEEVQPEEEKEEQKFSQNECEVKEECLDKLCFTKDCINYNCSYSKLVPCPHCDDGNKCSEDSFDYDKQECVNEKMIPCCGNQGCEAGENYENCKDDCPDCDDKSDCTEDVFDYEQQKCVNREITSCCGNGKCEPGETYTECAEDCVKTGYFEESEVWGGTIHVTGDVHIGAEAILTILPGTIVEVAALSDDQQGGVDDYTPNPYFPKDPARTQTKSTTILIWGILNASGTPDNKILFTSDSNNPTTYDWDGLSINHGKLEYAIVEYARYTNFQESSDVIVANNIFRHILECCICIGHSKSVSPQIINNEAYDCGHEAIDYAGGSSLIKGNYFHLGDRRLQPDPSKGGVGVIVYQNAYPLVEQNVIEDYPVGVYFNKDVLNEEEEGKKAIIRNNRLKNNRVNFNIDSGYPSEVILREHNHANVVIEGGYPAKAILTEKIISGYVRDCSFEVGENVPVSAKITYENEVVSTSDDGYFSITVEGNPGLLITADGYRDYIETPSRMVDNAFYLIPDDVYKDLNSVVWEEQIYNTNNWMRKWTRQPEIVIVKQDGRDKQVDTVVSVLNSDVFNKMTGGLYSSEDITVLDKLPEELYERKNRDGKILLYFADEMMNGGEVVIGGSAHSQDDGDGNILFGEITWKPSDNFNKFSVLHELVHAITTGGHINYKASIVSERYSTPNSEPTAADYKFLNCIYNSPLKRTN